jgi:cytidine deaminase
MLNLVHCLFITKKLFQKVTTHIKARLVVNQTSVFYEAKKYTWHAEQACIMKCKKKNLISKSYMILVKITKKEMVVHPCTMCDHIIKKYGVKKIVCFCKIIT